MDQYLVIGPDGKEFGPIDLTGLQQWVREGRVLKQTRRTKERRRRVRRRRSTGGRRELCAAAARRHAADRHHGPDPCGVQIVAFIGQAWELFKPHWVPLCVMFLIVSLGGRDSLRRMADCVRLMVGVNRAVLGMLAGRTPQIEMVFGGFDRFGQALLAALVIGLLVCVGLLFLIVPGIYLAIMWSLTNLVLAETQQDFWTAMQTSSDADERATAGRSSALPGADSDLHPGSAGVRCRDDRVAGGRHHRIRTRCTGFLQSRQTVPAVVLVP